MIKKTISFALIFLLMLLVYQFAVNMAKNDHFVTYTIDNGEIFTIDEKYSKSEEKDYYLLKVSNNDKTFIFELNNTFNKQKNIVKDIETIEENGYYCIGLKLPGSGMYSYPECVKDNTIYSYSSVKDEIDFSNYIKKIEDKAREKYSKESVKKDDYGLTINRDYIEDDEILAVYGYKQVTLHYTNFSRVFSFANTDNYKNQYGYLVENYYVVPKLTSLPSFTTLVKYDVIDGIKSEVSLPLGISKQSYINGVYNGKLYIFDKSNKRQFAIDPVNDDIEIVGSTEESGFAYINGVETSLSVYDLDSTETIFSESVDSYSSIQYDSIYPMGDYAIYTKNGNFYKVYKDYLEYPVYLFNEPDAKTVKVKTNKLYFIKGDSIYKYNTYGLFALATRSEFIYNYDNIYDVYIKSK